MTDVPLTSSGPTPSEAVGAVHRRRTTGPSSSEPSRPGPTRGSTPAWSSTAAPSTSTSPLTAAPGDVVALLGPNGAGKTTALRALAGLTPLSAGGHLRLDGADLDRTPPESRPVGVVFQDYLLFPHLTALDNVAFGPRCQGVPKAEARAQAAAWLDRMGLADHAGAKPRRLSGGQAQRVALARALATHPRLLLLDEPLAALDARTRLDVRAQLRRHLADFEAVAVLVTHDPLDAMVLADRLVVIEDGRVVQDGTPSDIARHPRTDYIAQLVGLNLYRGGGGRRPPRTSTAWTLARRSPTHRGPDRPRLRGLPAERRHPPPRPAHRLQRPQPLAVRGQPDWRRTATRSAPDLTGELPLAADLTTVAAAELDLHQGAPVWATVKAAQTHAYPA